MGWKKMVQELGSFPVGGIEGGVCHTGLLTLATLLCVRFCFSV
jgi:hypothetical protein